MLKARILFQDLEYLRRPELEPEVEDKANLWCLQCEGL